MKKLCFIGIILALTPSLSFGDDFRVNKLIQEKQRKMAELEKCMGSTKGLKIAGISTLGLTAVGVVGNVAEAKKINEYDDKIESTEKSIEKTQKQIDETRADLAKQKAEAEEKKRQEELKKNCKQSGGTWEDDGYCACGTRNYNSTTGKCEDVTIATVQLANGNTVTGVLNPTTGVLMDTNGNVINTTGGTIVGTATVAAGTMGGTSVGTDVGGTDVNGGSGDGNGNGNGGNGSNATITTGLAGVDLDVDAIFMRAYNDDGKCTDLELADNIQNGCEGMTKNSWFAQFNYGSVLGDSMCSSTEGGLNVKGTPSSTVGEWCWCKVKYYIPTGGSNQDVSASLSWVFVHGARDNVEGCKNTCADSCGRHVANDQWGREVLFN